MTLPEIDNLRITRVTDDILLLHQIKSPGNFSTCNGLLILPKKGRNIDCIVLDANIEPYLSRSIKEEFGPVSDYIFTHGHLDHSAHVYGWEQIGAKIHAPIQESSILLDLRDFYETFGFKEAMEFSVVEQFAEYNRYNPCKSVNSFEPGMKLKFEDFMVETLHFPGHSSGHTGFFLPSEKLIHISCLGFDLIRPGTDGFGPWYGFKNCLIQQYLEDIDFAEKVFIDRAEILTSSHSYIVINPDRTPFDYMRNKIKSNQIKVDQAYKKLDPGLTFEESLEELLKKDIFFPKRKLSGFLLRIYTLWESWIIKKHLEKREA